ncbi:hypothetical protein [Marivirga lumbricoides]|uniref:hypothetical protein n=1 Tax=Marivirga lumbricoides TaxID=1046115 RepID=UPI001668CC2A
MDRFPPPDNDRDKLRGNDGANGNLSKKTILWHRAPGTKRLPRCARNNHLILGDT